MSQIKASKLLQEIAEIIKDRHDTHGERKTSFDTIARLWMIYLNSQPSNSVNISGQDYSIMMTLMKIGRLCHGQPIKDHYMDAAGYMAIAAELADLKEEEDETTDFDYSPGAINFLPNK